MSSPEIPRFIVKRWVVAPIGFTPNGRPSNLAQARPSGVDLDASMGNYVCVDTVNGTTGQAAFDYATSKLCTAAALCVQEVTTAGQQVKEMEESFAAGGWRTTINSSRTTEGEVREGLSAGTAVGVKKA